MASHFQTEAWVNSGMAYRFNYQLWFLTPPFPSGEQERARGSSGNRV